MISVGVSRSQFLMEVYKNIPIAPNLIKKIMDEFVSETKGELWNSESELKKYYLEPQITNSSKRFP